MNLVIIKWKEYSLSGPQIKNKVIQNFENWNALAKLFNDTPHSEQFETILSTWPLVKHNLFKL